MSVEIRRGISIPDYELQYTFQRSAGPGGQNVNKVATRVTLLFDLRESIALSPAHKALIGRRLAGRINREGVLRVASQRHRTQPANRRAATERFVELLREALRPVRPRRKTAVPRAEKARRADNKRRRGQQKRNRGPVTEE